MRYTVRQLEHKLDEIDTAIAQMVSTQVRISKRSPREWDDPKIEDIEKDIAASEADRQRISDLLRQVERVVVVAA